MEALNHLQIIYGMYLTSNFVQLCHMQVRSRKYLKMSPTSTGIPLNMGEDFKQKRMTKCSTFIED